ncbi:hypothetical protein HDU84_000457 [Entophlyctis sp. JEL0112]|nr:hypothetical protein HDU84_000457 [Entophlyctis sp. JEL0112]
MKLLAARFGDRPGGYTRLKLAGFNRPGSDRAPLATVEFINGPEDSVRSLAVKFLPKVKADLERVRARRYVSTSLVVEDPLVPGSIVSVPHAVLRSDLSSREIKALASKERVLVKLVAKLEKSISSRKVAQENELRHEQLVQNLKARKLRQILKSLQEDVDKLDAASRAQYVLEYNAKQLLLQQKSVNNEPRYELRIDAAGKLSWDAEKYEQLFAEYNSRKKQALEQEETLKANATKALPPVAPAPRLSGSAETPGSDPQNVADEKPAPTLDKKEMNLLSRMKKLFKF